MTPPFLVRVPGDDVDSLVLGVSHPYLLLGPAPGGTRLRWVPAVDVEFRTVLHDRPWNWMFLAPLAAQQEGGDA